MNHEINKTVTIKERVGVVDDIYDDVYLISFYNALGEVDKGDYGYFLEEEVDEVMNVNVASKYYGL